MIIEDKLQRIADYLDEGSGNLNFTVNGTQVRTKGNCNKPGALLVALQAIINLEMMGFTDSFEEIIVLLSTVKENTKNEIFKKEIKKGNKDEAKDE